MKMTLWLGFLVTMAATMTGISRGDSFEPDNSPSISKSITTDGQAQSHSIDPAADEDWLIFTVGTYSGIVIEASGISGYTTMSLYNNQVAELLSDDDGGVGSFSRIQTTLPMGTYYVRIKEYNNKATINEYFVSVIATPIEVLSVEPDSAPQGKNLVVTITGQNTSFFQGNSTITRVWLSNRNAIIDANSFAGIDATTLEASFDIPVDALVGKWDVNIEDSIDGHLTLTEGFVVYTFPDLNGDGKVDNEDLALLSRHWLKAIVPNIVGMTESNATTAITATSLAVGTITQQYSDTITAGIVMSQTPSSGAAVTIGSEVDVVISLGRIPIVPDVIGMTQTEAQTALFAISLVIGTITQEYHNSIPLGNVISSEPVAGSTINAGSGVNLVISKGDVTSMAWVSINDPGVSGHEGFTGEMSKYETTNAQYCQFLNAALASGDIIIDGNSVMGANGSNNGADFVDQVYYNLAGYGTGYGATNGGAARIHYIEGSFTTDSGFEKHPVSWVSWYGSTAFCNYFGWRLPTEWEWQAVADYTGSFIYGCGMTITTSMANYRYSSHPNGTTVVGTFGTYGYGMCDMAGNLWEWTSSIMWTGYRVIRGGGWAHDDSCYCSEPGNYNLSYTRYHVGFRVCR